MYDIIVVGAGPAGLTAALYARRAEKTVLVIEKATFGGQITHSPRVENYPGFAVMSGVEFADKLIEQVLGQGAEIEMDCVTGISGSTGDFTVTTEGGEFKGKTVIVATGSHHRQLGLDKENDFIGEGISYCAVCDGAFYKDKTVAVIGGGNSAVSDALYLSRLAKKVYLIHRRNELRATKIYHQPLLKSENVEFVWNSTVSDFIADKRVTGIKINNVVTNIKSEISCDGVFVSIGRKPATDFIKDIIS